MKCAIMQPTYLPWAGYFNLIANVDIFVYFDDVQFAKRSWQQRNRIIIGSEEKFLTVPVITKNLRYQNIYETKTDEEQNWRKTHLQTIKSAYSKKDYGKQIIEIIEECFNNTDDSLCKINVSIINRIKNSLGINTKMLFSSELPIAGKKSEYLLKICEYLNANTYISALGSKEYIEDEGYFAKSTVKVEYQNYIPKEYPQKNCNNFIPYMSIVDIIANIGFNQTKKYILQED